MRASSNFDELDSDCKLEVSNHMSVANSSDLTFSIYPIEVSTS